MAVKLAVALLGLGAPACATADVSSLVQRSVVQHGDGPADTNDYDAGWQYNAGQRVELEGYGPDRNVTIISRGRGKNRYNLNMEGYGIYSNIEGKFLKAWKEPYPRSTDPEAGPVAHIMHFVYKSKPWIVKRGNNPGTWDVYIPGNGFVPNVPDSDIIREKSWYMSKTRKSKHGPAAVLVGKMPEKLPSRSGAKSNRDELVILGKNTVATPFEVPLKTPESRPAQAPIQVAPAQATPEHVALYAETETPAETLAEAPAAQAPAEEAPVQAAAEPVEEPAVEKAEAQPAAEKPTVSFGDAMRKTIDVAMKVATKGPNQYLREALPLNLGKVFINEKTEVRQCGDISSQLYCQMSSSRYNLACSGWTGVKCVSKEEVTSCDIFTSESACHKSASKFGIECAGWGGSSCLAKDAHPKLITSESICQSAEKKLGILVAGWGGDACLSQEATCSEISLPGVCNSADAKLGLNCLGWGGSSCLSEGATADQITTESLCKKAGEKFGIEVAGWGGSACLEKGAGVDQITSESICGRSAEALGIESGGWSGSACLKADEVKCSAITHPGICRDAESRLGVKCAGWSGAECLAPEDAACEKLTTKPICHQAAHGMGVACSWNGVMCMADAAGVQ